MTTSLATTKGLKWHFDGEAMWTAYSSAHDDGEPFQYRILPPRTRRTWFRLEANSEIMPNAQRHETLEQARKAAQAHEDQLIADLMKQASGA